MICKYKRLRSSSGDLSLIRKIDKYIPIYRIDRLSEAKAATATAMQEGSNVTDEVAARSVHFVFIIADNTYLSS